MCGIAGIFHPGTPKPVDPARIAAMIAAQAHRGPDGDGIWTAPGVGLGHRRLSIIDLAGSPQPMQAGALTVTYNGEIYNFAELRAELELKGAHFVTAGDTEVLLHGWRAWGPAMLDRLNGMFAFALHDADTGTLFLARDRMGVKPLHYVELSDGSLAFASELKGLLAHPLLRRVPDVTAVEDFLAYGYVPDDACLVAGVKKLPAGTFLSVQRWQGVPRPKRWWDVGFADRATGSAKALGEELLARMRDGVRSRMVADVPLGAFLSGGVDSSVAAVLIHEAIGDQLTCVYVDHGLMRKDESAQVVGMFREHYNLPLIHANESDLFLGKLEGVSDPETKRKIIGGLFIEVFEKYADQIGGADFLAQGTLYPDVIESVSFSGGPSVTIKSHHNVGGLPERMNMQLVEPLRELFKDEVRALGRELGLPDSFIGRHPFPGPGLAIRCPGEITHAKLDILREADAVYIDQIRKHGLYDEIWQAFVAILPVKTVGVMGDGRTYDYACALRAVTSVDGMTADYYPFSHEFLGETATRIINEVSGINRVTYDITSKPPGTIEWE